MDTAANDVSNPKVSGWGAGSSYRRKILAPMYRRVFTLTGMFFYPNAELPVSWVDGPYSTLMLQAEAVQ